MNSETILTGVFGHPVAHSMSPLMHNLAFEELGLNMRYAAFDVEPERLQDAVNGIRALNFRGVNVTIPHKVKIMDYLDELDEEAKEIGAVNTVVNDRGKLIGYNTDGRGYIASLVKETGTLLQGQRVLVIGAGGAARAIVVSLARSGVERIWVANRTLEKAEALAAAAAHHTEVDAVSSDRVRDLAAEATILINATSVGMHPHTEETPIDASLLHASLVVSDLVYNPLKTKLLLDAEKAGAQTHGGLGMLIHQGALAFQYWTGEEAPVDLMQKTVLSRLERVRKT